MTEIDTDSAVRILGCVPDHSLPTARCATHGGIWTITDGRGGYCQTETVLEGVAQERARQFARYGTNTDIEDGTGPETRWLQPYSSAPAWVLQNDLRDDYEEFEAEEGAPTWVHLVREEVAEAFQESDPVKLREELLQVAALAVSWVEKIDARGGN